MLKRYKNMKMLLLIILIGGVTITLYQNCAQSKLSFGIADPTKAGPNDCEFDGIVVKNQNSTHAFYESTVGIGKSCQMQLRECKNGYLSGNFQYSTCQVGLPPACLFQGRTIAHGSSIDAYSKEIVNFGISCDTVKQTRTCMNGTLLGSAQYMYSACTTASNTVNTEIGNNGQIYGLVKNAVNGNAIKGASIQLYSSGGQLLNSLTTDEYGAYRIRNLADANYTVSISAPGFISAEKISIKIVGQIAVNLDYALSPTITNNQIRIVTSWTGPKENAVIDLDAYLSLPNVDPLTITNYNSSIIFFLNKSSGGAMLDIDDTSWSGPETITINDIKNGTYHFYVSNYTYPCFKDYLGNSDIRVTVYVGNNTPKYFIVPAGRGHTYEPFRIVNGSIVEVNQYNDMLYSAKKYFVCPK